MLCKIGHVSVQTATNVYCVSFNAKSCQQQVTETADLQNNPQIVFAIS